MEKSYAQVHGANELQNIAIAVGSETGIEFQPRSTVLAEDPSQRLVWMHEFDAYGTKIFLCDQGHCFHRDLKINVASFDAEIVKESIRTAIAELKADFAKS